ncbi:acyl-CoA dehydrogenase family member 11-like [Saccostrea echinata]|uniref:acyl-CoA dehydrogenase family member 11-like n=1 Tax=Saccostrea echinata TaxID=191078 RepID=UPI002A83A2D3|nr:acyl-CoA dehydrogenase family member 11-like [Saccostrea echinata]
MSRIISFNRVFSCGKYKPCNKKYCTAAEKKHATRGRENGIEKHATFASAKIGPFFQSPPKVENQYTGDAVLQSYVKRFIPNQIREPIETDLIRFGERVATEIYELGLQCEREPPQLIQYDAWGNRVDRLITSPAWKRQHDIAAEEGLIATAYEEKYGEWSRLYQIVKLFLYSPSSGLYSCPLAMTDGAARLIKQLPSTYSWVKDCAYSHLTSRDPTQFWTSGQWMTERRGGSDVASGTETIAVPQGDGSYRLHGYKWFSSATDANMTLTLARVQGQDGSITQGTKGLSLFYLEVFDDQKKLNNIQVEKMKNKLGTRQLPTAELLLDGAVAYRISEEGRGVAGISNMLTISRIHNALSSASGMRRILSMARDYSTRRTAFGDYLKNYPLHVQTLARMEVEVRAATLLVLEVARLLGREDTGIASDQESLLLRLLTPLAKLYTAKQAMSVVSEGLECFGGQGYIEDTGLPGLLRDSQVLTIWEGTTNILSLDVLRAITKSKGEVLVAFHDDVISKVTKVSRVQELQDQGHRVKEATLQVMNFVQKNPDKLNMAARDLAYSLTRIYMGAILLDHAVECGLTQTDTQTARRWCEKDLSLVVTNHKLGHYNSSKEDLRLVYEHYTG